jgi:hypothetical protein
MIERKYHHIEMISPISWSCMPDSGEIVAEFEAVCPDTDNLILTIPLHEDFFDFALEYCRQYKIHIEKKLK